MKEITAKADKRRHCAFPRRCFATTTPQHAFDTWRRFRNGCDCLVIACDSHRQVEINYFKCWRLLRCFAKCSSWKTSNDDLWFRALRRSTVVHSRSTHVPTDFFICALKNFQKTSETHEFDFQFIMTSLSITQEGEKQFKIQYLREFAVLAPVRLIARTSCFLIAFIFVGTNGSSFYFCLMKL